MIPKENISPFSEKGLDSKISGAIYPGVPALLTN